LQEEIAEKEKHIKAVESKVSETEINKHGYYKSFRGTNMRMFAL